MNARPKPPEVTHAVKLDGETWMACPIDGAACVLVCVTRLGEEWARDVLTYHIEHHHRPWR